MKLKLNPHWIIKRGAEHYYYDLNWALYESENPRLCIAGIKELTLFSTIRGNKMANMNQQQLNKYVEKWNHVFEVLG